MDSWSSEGQVTVNLMVVPHEKWPTRTIGRILIWENIGRPLVSKPELPR